MVCRSCNFEKGHVFRHKFKNGKIHLKFICFECGFSCHVRRTKANRDQAIGDYGKHVWEHVKKSKIDESLNCKNCNKSFVNKFRRAHRNGFCTKKCRSIFNGTKVEFKNKVPEKIISTFNSKGFYETREWLTLRYKIIQKYGRKCMACGAENTQIHVDHIKPVSKYPELKLNPTNLQILCRDCNLGKSNKDMTDFRPKEEIIFSDI